MYIAGGESFSQKFGFTIIVIEIVMMICYGTMADYKVYPSTATSSDYGVGQHYGKFQDVRDIPPAPFAMAKPEQSGFSFSEQARADSPTYVRPGSHHDLHRFRFPHDLPQEVSAVVAPLWVSDGWCSIYQPARGRTATDLFGVAGTASRRSASTSSSRRSSSRPRC
jgi:hypothetical protein